MNYADAFESPVIVTIGGKEVPLTLLSQRDVQPWLAELTDAAQARDAKLIPATAKPNDKFTMARQVARAVVTPAELEPHVFTDQGTIRVLTIALKKAGVSEADAAAFIDSQPIAANEEIAVRVCGLFSRNRLAAMYGPKETDGDKPNPTQPV